MSTNHTQQPSQQQPSQQQPSQQQPTQQYHYYKIMSEMEDKYDTSSDKNLCIKCGVDMGVYNPRQYCGKTYCKNIDDN